MSCARLAARATAAIDDEWETHRLDLAAYLARIGYDGSLAPTAGTLAALHRAHVVSIPFENLDLLLGRGIRVDLDSVQNKLVAERRGGYCYEHGLLFAAALERLGWTVSRVLARVGDAERLRPRTHMALHVSSGGSQWLADVGFGSGMLEPLPWNTSGDTHRQGRWAYQLIRDAPGQWRLREITGEGSTTLYSFTDEPQHASDIEVANHFISTHPRSPFVGQPVVMRKTLESQLHLRGRRLTTTGSDDGSNVHVLDDAQFAAALSDRFRIPLTPGEIETITRRLPDDEAAAPPATPFGGENRGEQ